MKNLLYGSRYYRANMSSSNAGGRFPLEMRSGTTFNSFDMVRISRAAVKALLPSREACMTSNTVIGNLSL
jgi:hypothetical protein